MDRLSRFLPLAAVALFVGFFAWVGRGGSMAMKLSPLSAPAPALSLADLQGVKHSLADYRGQVVIVHFWATWCGPCRHEIPGLSAMARDLDTKGLTLLAVHVGESPSSLPAFLRQTPIAGRVLQDGNSEVFHLWGGEVIPTTYVIGRDGRVHLVSRGAVDWTDAKNRQRIEELLAQAWHEAWQAG